MSFLLELLTDAFQDEPRLHLAALPAFARHDWLPQVRFFDSSSRQPHLGQVQEILKEVERLRIPLNAKYCSMLALCYAHNQKPQEALAYGKRVLDLTGSVSAELMTGLAPMLANNKQCDEAMRFYEAYRVQLGNLLRPDVRYS